MAGRLWMDDFETISWLGDGVECETARSACMACDRHLRVLLYGTVWR